MSETADPVNWQEDSWFVEHHVASLTPEFQHWWVEYYGRPEDYDPSHIEQHEYWARCAFALTGWLASRQVPSTLPALDLLGREDADVLAGVLSKAITADRQLAAVEHASGQITEPELKHRNGYADIIETIAVKLFPNWTKA